MAAAGSAIQTVFSGVDADRIEYLDDGAIQSQNVTLQALNIELNSQDAFGLNVSNNKEGLRNAVRDLAAASRFPKASIRSYGRICQVRSGDQRALGGGMFVNDGEFYDGKRSGVTTFIGWGRSRHFRANLNYQYNEISFPGKGDDSSQRPSALHDARLRVHHARRPVVARAIFSSRCRG